MVMRPTDAAVINSTLLFTLLTPANLVPKTHKHSPISRRMIVVASWAPKAAALEFAPLKHSRQDGRADLNFDYVA